MITIQEPKNSKLAGLLQGISILLKYDCDADISISTVSYHPSYCIDISVDSQHFTKEDLQILQELGWEEQKHCYDNFTTWDFYA